MPRHDPGITQNEVDAFKGVSSVLDGFSAQEKINILGNLLAVALAGQSDSLDDALRRAESCMAFFKRNLTINWPNVEKSRRL